MKLISASPNTQMGRFVNIIEALLYENIKKVDANDCEKELRFADERKRANILFEDTYKKPIITKQTRENILNSPNLYSNCDIRVRMGKFYTD